MTGPTRRQERKERSRRRRAKRTQAGQQVSTEKQEQSLDLGVGCLTYTSQGNNTPAPMFNSAFSGGYLSQNRSLTDRSCLVQLFQTPLSANL